MLPEVEQLKNLRLELDLSYQEIADAMKAIGAPVSARTIHYLIVNSDQSPHQTTLHKIRKYLAHVKGGQERAARGVDRRAAV